MKIKNQKIFNLINNMLTLEELTICPSPEKLVIPWGIICLLKLYGEI